MAAASTSEGARGPGAGAPARGEDSKLELGAVPDAAPANDSSDARLLGEDADGSRAARKTLLNNVAERASNAGAIPAVLSYCVASIMMTVVNKYAVSGAHFTMNLFVLLCQCTVCVAMVWTAKRLGFIRVRELNARDVKTWIPISTMLVFVIWTGSKALQHLSIPVYTIFKNLTIILIAYGEVFWFEGHVTSIVFSSFVLMVLSSVIAAWPDISPHLGSVPYVQPQAPAPPSASASLGTSGYFWMLTNCLVSATYVLVMRKRIKSTGFKDWDTMFYNNLLSIPVLLIMSILVENWTPATWQRNFPEERRGKLAFAILLSGTGAVFISYTTAWCIRVTSSTTYSMVGALNKLPLALSGMVFFGDPVTLTSTTSIGVGFLAGLLYAVGKNKQAEAARLANTAATGVNQQPSGSGHTSDPKGVIPLHHMPDRPRQD